MSSIKELKINALVKGFFHLVLKCGRFHGHKVAHVVTQCALASSKHLCHHVNRKYILGHNYDPCVLAETDVDSCVSADVQKDDAALKLDCNFYPVNQISWRSDLMTKL